MKKLITFLFIISLFIGCKKEPVKILIFSKTEGFRHESIAVGIKMFESLAEKNNWIIEKTESAEDFNSNNLKQYASVVFLSTTGDVFTRSQELEFKRYIQAGGGFLGIHAAADTEYEWPWYGELVGAYFNGHPNNPNVRTAVVEKTKNHHRCTDHLPQQWERNDEWYNYKKINPNVISVLNLDESSYEGGTNGDTHPIAWYHEFDGGRAFYTGGGHTDESFEDPKFIKHLEEALLWTAANFNELNYNKPGIIPEENRFVKEELDNYFQEPMELDLLPEGHIVFIERKGAIKLYDLDMEATRTLTNVEVYSGEEDGLIGLALDPNFEKTKHIFLTYSHPDQPYQSISRFDFDYEAEPGDVLKNEKVILKVPVQRDECCHSGGSLEFDHNGYLWISIGDNTNPHESNGFSPTDEQEGRGPFDAQKSSSNTADLRGKLLRIKVNADGTYDIPDGNLFPKDGSKGRPEIYVMGCRNPFRFSIDSETNYVYWGEVGPDSNVDSLGFGPRGYDEVNQAKAPGFFGWPYFIGNNYAYNDYNFAAKKSSQQRDPQKPVNDSPNNTGEKILPPAQAAMIWYPYAKSDDFPLMGSGSRNAMAGPIFHKEKFTHENRFPDYYDDKLFVYDWMRGWIMSVSFDENGDRKRIEPFMPGTKWNNLMDVALGKDGYFYTLEYGSGWFTANENAVLSRVKYLRGNRVPAAKIKVDKTSAAIPFVANFDASNSVDPDGDNLTYSWEFGDGATALGKTVSHTYENAGIYQAKLVVSDDSGESNATQIKILAGNTPPEVDVQLAGNSNFYFPDQTINYKVLVSDQEDGAIAESKIALTVDYLEMGYDETSIAQGHMALSQIKSSSPGLEAIGKSDCVSCHKVNEKSIGPSYIDISKKYVKQNIVRSKKIDYLTAKIKNGGGGVWGETAMAAHPDLKPSDVRSMANYILGLTEEKKTVSLPATGSYDLKIPKGKSSGGKFVLKASYTDKGANGIEPIRTFSNITLLPANLSATQFTSAEKATKMTITADMVPGLEEEFDIVIVNDEAVITYSDLDLTGLSTLTINYSAPKEFNVGGQVKIYLDNTNSDAIFSGEMVESQLNGPPNEMVVPISALTGVHDIILKFKSNQSGASVGSMTTLSFKN